MVADSQGRRKKRWFLSFKRSPKIFVPTPKNQIVIPFRTISVALIFILSLLCVYLAFRSDLFLVHNVEITSVPATASFLPSLPPTNLKAMIEDEVKGRSLFFVDTKRIKEKVLKNFLTLSDIWFKKDFPNRLEIEVYEREPVAMVEIVRDEKLEVGGWSLVATNSAAPVEWLAVDYEGLIFVKVASFSGLPVLNLTNRRAYTIGDRLAGPRVGTVVEVLEGLKRWEIDVVKINLGEFNKIEMTLRNGTLVLFSSLKDSTDQVTSLQLILSSSKIKGKSLDKIDLRFDKPVVKYRTKV